jgi:PadR family transcriptional regulator, regulatory protein PadR
MERDGLVDAEWDTTESGRKAKFYRITEQGRKRLRAETKEFAGFVKMVSPILLGA